MDKKDSPPEMAHLDKDTRSRAAKLADQLSEEGYPGEEATRIALRRMTDEKRAGAAQSPAQTEAEKYVTPHEEGWAVVSPEGEHQTNVFATKEEALANAREIARADHAKVHIRDRGDRVVDPDESL